MSFALYPSRVRSNEVLGGTRKRQHGSHSSCARHAPHIVTSFEAIGFLQLPQIHFLDLAEPTKKSTTRSISPIRTPKTLKSAPRTNGASIPRPWMTQPTPAISDLFSLRAII